MQPSRKPCGYLSWPLISSLDHFLPVSSALPFEVDLQCTILNISQPSADMSYHWSQWGLTTLPAFFVGDIIFMIRTKFITICK